MRKILLPVLLLLPALAGQLQAQSAPAGDGKPAIVVNIDNADFRKLVVALPPFIVRGNGSPDAQKFAAQSAEELGYLLNFSGLFSVIDPNSYADLNTKLRTETLATDRAQIISDPKKAGMAGVDTPQWKTLGIDSITIGEVETEGNKLNVLIRTIDVIKGEPILARKYSNVELGEIKLVMRRYGDAILKSYTGKPGIFNSKIVFIGRKVKGSDKQVYIADFDGSNATQVTKEKTVHVSARWSPDARYVTFTSYEDKNPDLFIYDVKTGQKRKLSGKQGINSGGSWSPSGNLVAFSRSADGNTDLFTIRPDGKKEAERLLSGNGIDVDPAFSPNGKMLAFVSGRFGNPHVFVADLQWNGDSVKITGDKRLTYAGWWNATPAWTPESDKIAFAGFDKDINRFDLFLMNPDGTKMERLTLRAGDNESPSWSPNGQMIVYHSNRTNGKDIKGQNQLFIMNRDGSGQRQLNTGLYEAQSPNWSINLDN